MTRDPTTTTFHLPSSHSGDRIWRTLSEPFSLERPRREAGRRTCLDTFDWRLFDDGLALIREDGDYHLVEIEGEKPVAALRDHGGAARFWWDFPEGALRDALRGRLEERALLEMSDVSLSRRSTGLRNPDGKIVARVSVETATMANGRGGRRRVRAVRVVPVRGYRDEFDDVCRRLEGVGLARRDAPWIQDLLAGGERTPGDYSSRLRIELDPGMETIEAAGRIFATLLGTMERNVAGIRDDIDTEFLHDFRVAVRRTRAGLGQIKDVYAPADTRRHGDAFKRLGRLTNRLRDLDVYLLDRARYEAMLPDALRPALGPMFEKLGRERAREHARVVAAFDGGAPAEQLQRWRAFLEAAPGRSRGENAAQPVATMASRWIRKRHARLLARGRAIAPSSDDDALHALRIEGKKLRYLLEFFSSLYDRDRVGALVKQLKKLQDNLGEFNDLSVQTADLGRRLAGNRAKPDTAAAIGGLMTALDARRTDVRRHFAATFREFDSAGSGRTWDELFGEAEVGE